MRDDASSSAGLGYTIARVIVAILALALVTAVIVLAVKAFIALVGFFIGWIADLLATAAIVIIVLLVCFL